MFMTTTLGHYQLPLFGTTATAISTEIGADQRSLFLRPITAAGDMASESWPNTVEVPSAESGYGDWRDRTAQYQNAATGGAAGEGSTAAEATGQDDNDATGAAASEAGDDVAANGDGGTVAAEESGSAAPPETPSSGSGSGSGTSSGGGSGSSGSGGGSGGLLGWLFG